MWRRTHLVRARAVLALAAVVFGTTFCHADAVEGPPDDCVEGTIPATGHCGPHCEPATCQSDADCSAGTCQDVDYCTTTVVCAGNVGPDEDLSQYERTSVFERCPSSGACSQGTCNSLKVCAPVPAPIDTGSAREPVEETPSEDCSCRLGRPAGPAAPWLFVPLLGLAGLVRRRRTRALPR